MKSKRNFYIKIFAIYATLSKYNLLENNSGINYSRKEISSFKKVLKNKLYSSLNFYEINNDNNKLSFEDSEKDREYFFRYTSYINHEFNSNIVNMIVLYINDT